MYVRILYGIYMSTHATRTRVSFWLMSGSNISKHVKMIGHQKLAEQKISTNNSNNDSLRAISASVLTHRDNILSQLVYIWCVLEILGAVISQNIVCV